LIPIILLCGVVFSRWPIVLPAVILWPLYLLTRPGSHHAATLIGAGALAGINALVGVAIGLAFRWTVRRLFTLVRSTWKR